MGTVAIRVETIPVDAYWIASNEIETPRNGPKKDPFAIAIIPFGFLKASNTFDHLLNTLIMSTNPTIPVIILI